MPIFLAGFFPEGLWVVALASTFQHAIYASLFYVKSAATIVKRNHSSFILFAYSLKIFTVLIGMWTMVQADGYPNLSLPLTILGVALFAFGCHLNLMVHQLLGVPRIYYGFELGLETCEWIYDYPYSVFKHPQYLGAVLQLVGAWLMYCRNEDGSLRIEMALLATYLSFLYYVTVQVESKGIIGVKSKESVK